VLNSRRVLVLALTVCLLSVCVLLCPADTLEGENADRFRNNFSAVDWIKVGAACWGACWGACQGMGRLHG
jgi:hypothetical protein